MDQSLAVYLPLDRRHALATGRSLPDRTQGAALFADISGFTPLAEALVRELGPRRGAEELPRQLNQVYDAVIREVDHYGGSVIGFAGDAITCWFDGDTSLRATACGLAMQEAMRAFATVMLPSGSMASLAMKVAVASGGVRRFLVGDPQVQLLDTLAGATLSRMAAAEQMAEKGEVILDEGSAHALGERLDIQDWRSDEHGTHFAVVAGLRATVSPPPQALLAPGTLSVDVLRPWLLPTVYERLQAGQGEFLTELRPAVALFLHFGGIEYDTDPAAGHKLNAFVCWVQRLLVQYGGTLLQLTIGEKGSYLYAAFGAPRAYEDDARRAALSALALRTPPEELAFIREIQIGLTRGTMRAGAYGGTTRRTYGSLGDEVNLAARLMQVAAPGQIIASQRVQRATARLFTWQALPPLPIKGKREPIPLFVLLEKAPTSTIHLTEPTYTLPLVGRIEELARLAEKLSLVLQGRGQVVGITAEAGMGKSRLVAEAIRHAQAQGFTAYGGECQSYGTTIPYLVWQPIWRAFFGLSPTDSPAQQAEQLTRAVAGMDPALLGRLPLLGSLLGLPLAENEVTEGLSLELRKASREALLVELLRHRARELGAQQGALLLVLEDCHWLDAASHDLLEAVGRAIWHLPVLVLLAYRPPELERLAAPRVSPLPYFTQLHLTELSEAEAAELLANRLAQQHPEETRAFPTTLCTQLTAHAQGNPFYLEELLNYLHDQRIDPYEQAEGAHLELPTSLHRLILSRIDRLTEPQKITLKVASIIGRLFPLSWLLGYYPLLGAPESVQRDLEALARLDLTPLERPEPERMYLFKHIVTREVAYESLPYATRAHLHEQLADFLEQQGSAAVEGYLDLLAHHYGQSDNLAKKRQYLRLAGEAAQAVYANDAAQSYYERLLPLVDEIDDQQALHLQLGTVLVLMGQLERAERYYQTALRLAMSMDQPLAQAQSMLALGKLYESQAQYEQAQQWLLQALARWESLDEPGGSSRTLAELGQVAFRQAHYAQARAYLARSQQICAAQGDRHGLAQALNWLAGVDWNQGDYEVARERYEESLATRRDLRDKEGMARTLINLGTIAQIQGDEAAAQALREEGLALFREMGDKRGIAWALFFMSDTVIQARLEEALSLFRELGDTRGIAWCQGNLGSIAWRQAQYETAQELFEESLRLGQEIGDQAWIAFSQRGLGLVAYRRAEVTDARRYYREGLQIAQAIGIKQEQVNALLSLAALFSRHAAPDQLRQALHLAAAAAELQKALGAPLDAIAQVLHDEILAIAHARLGEANCAAAWAEGQGMTLDAAVALALAER